MPIKEIPLTPPIINLKSLVGLKFKSVEDDDFSHTFTKFRLDDDGFEHLDYSFTGGGTNSWDGENILRCINSGSWVLNKEPNNLPIFWI